jgi:hypothetical protein
MSRFYKTLIVVFIANIFLALGFVFFVLPAEAAYKIEISLPYMPKGTEVAGPAEYIRNFFIFGLSLIAFMAVAALGLGGIMWMLSGSVTTTAKAKDLILGAFMGLLLLLGSYLLLYTIDPTLTNLSPLDPAKFIK